MKRAAAANNAAEPITDLTTDLMSLSLQSEVMEADHQPLALYPISAPLAEFLKWNSIFLRIRRPRQLGEGYGQKETGQGWEGDGIPSSNEEGTLENVEICTSERIILSSWVSRHLTLCCGLRRR
jgi:hypothetical protein